jgi:phospholipid/cholesterol/gamma-HCH transport system permease protein
VEDFPGYGSLKNVAAMGMLLVEVVRTAFTRPYSWVPEAISEAALAFRRAWFPVFISQFLLSTGGAIAWFSPLVNSLGTIDRVASGTGQAWMREEGTWLAVMVVAAVAGSAMTADLGARKIREEIDALSVLGVSAVRQLVVPRVIALALVAPALGVVDLIAGDLPMYFIWPIYGDHNVTLSGFLENQFLVRWPIDLWWMLMKNATLGVFVGIVCCSKGLAASGGTEGVGRAVNQAVLISFLGIFIIADIGNVAFYSWFPDPTILRG